MSQDKEITEEIIAVAAAPSGGERVVTEEEGLIGDLPLDGCLLPLEGVKTCSASASSTDLNSSISSTESNWLPIPEAICVYHQRGSCLRLNCRFFHGSADQLKDLRETGCSHYRFDQSNKVELPKEGEDLSDSPEEPTLGIRFGDETGRVGSAKGRKKPIVCLAYISGTCRRSDCRFTHLPANVRPLPATACAYFAVGTCKRNTCRYFHGTEEELAKLKSQGATMYNPTTNESYDKIPDFEEPPNSVRSRGDASQGSGSHHSGSPGMSGSTFPHQGQTGIQPPPYLSVQGSPPPMGAPNGVPQVMMLPPGGQMAPPPHFQPPQQIVVGPNGQPMVQPQQFIPQQPQQFIQTPQGMMALPPGQQPPPGATIMPMQAQSQQQGTPPQFQQHQMMAMPPQQMPPGTVIMQQHPQYHQQQFVQQPHQQMPQFTPQQGVAGAPMMVRQ